MKKELEDKEWCRLDLDLELRQNLIKVDPLPGEDMKLSMMKCYAYCVLNRVDVLLRFNAEKLLITYKDAAKHFKELPHTNIDIEEKESK